MPQEQQLLYEKVEAALAKREKFDVGTDEYENADLDVQMAQDDLDRYNQVECEAIGEHRRMTIPDRGYDVCFNCGSRF